MCSYFIVGFLKNWVFTFLDFKGGPGSNSPKFWEGLLIRGVGRGGAGVSYRFRIFWVGLWKKRWSQYFRVRLIPWRTLCLFLVFYGSRGTHGYRSNSLEQLLYHERVECWTKSSFFKLIYWWNNLSISPY